MLILALSLICADIVFKATYLGVEDERHIFESLRGRRISGELIKGEMPEVGTEGEISPAHSMSPEFGFRPTGRRACHLTLRDSRVPPPSKEELERICREINGYKWWQFWKT